MMQKRTLYFFLNVHGMISYISAQVDDLTVGSQGMGAFKAGMLALVGMGSVSKACVCCEHPAQSSLCTRPFQPLSDK